MSVRKKFRQLIETPGMTMAPGAYDALSARIIEQQGFECVTAGGYAAVGSLLGQPDTGQSNMRDYADHYGRIAQAVSIPTYVDADTGFGGVNNVRQMIRAFEAAGVCAVFISDQVFPNRCGYMAGKQVIPVEEHLAKMKAALDARTDPDFFIAARSDAFHVEGLDRAIERCQMYMDIGCDMAKPMGADKPEDFARVCREVPGPQIANFSNANPKAWPSFEAMEKAGARMVSYPSAALFAAVGAVTRAMAALKRDRNTDAIKHEFVALQDYYDLVGLDAQTRKEEELLEAAKAVVAKRAKR